MLTEEQIKWVAPVLKEAGALLDKMPDFPSNDCYRYREESLNNSLNCNPGDYEFFFDEDIGLYKITDHERGQLFQEVYGRTKKEIIHHIADYYIRGDAYFYANKQYRKFRIWNILIGNDLNKILKKRLRYFHNIIDKHIESLEDCVFPPAPEEEPLKLLKQGKYISLFSKGNKRIVKVSLPDIHKYWRSSCFLGVLHEEEGYPNGVAGVACEIHERENSAIDISRFYEWAEFLTLRVLILRDDNKIDDQDMERLDIDKEDKNAINQRSLI